MQIKNRLISRCVKIDGGNITLDIGQFLRNLLLFDTYILDSVRLKEFSHLVSILGYDQVLRLLDYKHFKIRCHALTIGSVGQAQVLGRKKESILPIGSYAFAAAGIFYRKKFISDCLRSVEGLPGISFKQTKKLKKAIALKLIEEDPSIGKSALEHLISDLSQNIPTIRLALFRHLKQEFKVSKVPDTLFLKVHQISESEFKTETNLGNIFGFNEVQVHKAVEKALLSIGGLNQRIIEMKAFSALSGFRINEIPIYESKLDFLIEQISPEKNDLKFRKIISIAGLPSFDEVGHGFKIDIEKFIKLKKSRECKEFTEWLSQISSDSDKDISERIRSWRSKIASLVGCRSGKVIRFLTTTGLGTLLSVAGPVVGAIDAFVIEKIFPCPGPIAFINRLYPSIFEEHEDMNHSS